jgi:hypothetical protein
MDVTDLRRRQEEIEDRIYHTQHRLKTALLRARGKVDYRRQSLRETQMTATRVAIGAGIGILLSLLATIFRSRKIAKQVTRAETERFDVSGRYEPYYGESRRFDNDRDRVYVHERDRYFAGRDRFDDRYARSYPPGHREPIPQGYGRRLSHDEDDHEWARYPGVDRDRSK